MRGNVRPGPQLQLALDAASRALSRVVKDFSGAGDTMVAADVHTDTAGGGREPQVKRRGSASRSEVI